MLALNEKDAKNVGSYFKMAVSQTDKKFAVYIVTEGCYGAKPCIRPKRVDKLLTDSDWLEVACKKYRLPGSEIKKLKRTWATGAPTFDSTNVKAQLCFREMEKTILGRMRRIYNPEKKMQLLPWFDHGEAVRNNKPANILIIGNTSSGKTTFLKNILCQLHKGENWATGRKIIAFTLHPEDPSLAAARACHKKNWVDIDLSKIGEGDIDIDAIPKGSLVIFDDTLELSTSDPRRHVLYNLLNTIATVGRHHVGKKGNKMRGTEFCCLTHYGSRRELNMARNAATYTVLFTGTSKQQAVHFLKSRLGYNKKGVLELLRKAGNSRWVCIRNHYPQYLLSTNHVEVLT